MLNSRSLPSQLTVITAATIATFGLSILCQWPELDRVPLYVIANALASAVFVTTGTIICSEKDAKRLGIGLIAAGMVWSLQFLGTWNSGLLSPLAMQFNGLFFGIGAWGMISYPDMVSRNKKEKVLLFSLLGLLPAIQFLLTISSRPEWEDFPESVWWPTVFQSRFQYDFLLNTLFACWSATFLLGTYLIIHRVRMLNNMDSVFAKPIVIGFCLSSSLSMLIAFIEPYPTSSIGPSWFYCSIAVLTIPVGILIAYANRRFRHASIAENLNRSFAEQAPSIESVKNSLRETLKDAELEIFYWDPEKTAYIDTEGIPLDTASFDGKSLRKVLDRNGEQLAIVLMDESLERHSRIFETAINASRVALENARLYSMVNAQLTEVSNSRVRIAEAAHLERRRIERDLHDGVQQRLLAVLTRLGTLGRQTSDEQSVHTIKSIASDLKDATGSLRDLTYGISPLELRQFGLKAAIEVVVERMSIDVRVNATNSRYPEIIESTAYFVICEALTNVIKHSSATSAEVVIKNHRNKLIIQVADDGIGVVDAKVGTGLNGLSDRVTTLGGEIAVESSAKGVTLKAVIPCA